MSETSKTTHDSFKIELILSFSIEINTDISIP